MGWIGRLAGAAGLASCFAAAQPAFGETLVVFAAASTANVIDELAQRFEAANSGIEVLTSFAASSILARQIANGAPADIFLSAHPQWMKYLADRQLIDEGSRANLASNRVVLVAAPGSDLDVAIGPGFPLAQALAGERLAMGDPDHVPAGIYGREALLSLGVWAEVEPLVARAVDVRAALVLVTRREAVAGIIYATDTALVASLRLIGTFPTESHSPIVYPVAAVAGQASEAGAQLLAFLKSAEASAVFASHGFSPPPGL